MIAVKVILWFWHWASLLTKGLKLAVLFAHVQGISLVHVVLNEFK